MRIGLSVLQIVTNKFCVSAILPVKPKQESYQRKYTDNQFQILYKNNFWAQVGPLLFFYLHEYQYNF
jgi:hypothetical protein